MIPATLTGDLRLGHLLAAAGLDFEDVLVLRHTYTADGLRSREDLTAEKLLEYTRGQGVNNKVSRTPPRHWLVFMADGARRSRLQVAYENLGENVAERTQTMRYFNLQPSDLLSSLAQRLVVEWSKDTVNWAKTGASASNFSVVEIADPTAVPFPGFDHVVLTYRELQDVVDDSRYASWRTALGAVQGIYLITDTRSGHVYVGKADGAERILGRWTAYARDGHGGNVALRELARLDPANPSHFQFSILRVFGPSVPKAEVDLAESHFKRALLSVRYGLNRN